MNTINVCGVLVFARPEHTAAVRRELEKEDGVEIHAVTEDGRLIVTIEKEDQQQTGDLLNKMQTLKHVISASMIYQYYEKENDWEMAS
mgnify:CR=1 FL=1